MENIDRLTLENITCEGMKKSKLQVSNKNRFSLLLAPENNTKLYRKWINIGLRPRYEIKSLKK